MLANNNKVRWIAPLTDVSSLRELHIVLTEHPIQPLKYVFPMDLTSFFFLIFSALIKKTIKISTVFPLMRPVCLTCLSQNNAWEKIEERRRGKMR